MPFPYNTVGTYTYQNYSYDYTDTVENLMLNNSFNVGAYPDGMFWGGISKYDAPYTYPATAAYDFDAKTITISDLYAGIPGVEIPRTQISYCYVPAIQQNVSPFTSAMINWQLDNGLTDLTNQHYMALTNFATRVRNTLFSSKIPLNKIIFCPYVYYFNLADWNASSTSITRQQTSIEQWETWEQNNQTSDKILIGFGVGESGYIYSNTRVINAGWQNSFYYNYPDNGMFGTVIYSPLSSGFVNGNFNIYIQGSGGDRTKYALSRESASHEDYYYTTISSNKIYINSNNLYLPFYNGDVTIDVTDLLAIATKNTYWRKQYTQGDKYLIGGHTSNEYQWASVTFQGEIYRVYDSLDDLLKYIASFGRAFCGAMPQRYQHEVAGIIDDLIFAPVLDDNKVYHGEYTRGLANATNPFFTFNDSTDTSYVPKDQGDEPPGDNENIGDKITRPASIGIGGTNGFVTQYALDKFDVAQLGALLWTSFVDQDYWQNYLFSLAVDTGSFSLSSLLNFFVSLKVYPFSLVNIRSFDSWGNDMYIGTGVVPLHFTSPLHIINNYADYISGGTIEIPRYFNDYRDYINTEITLYLPFCGTVHLNPGDVIGNKITIQYAIDFATGGCIAYVDLETGDGAGYPVGAMPGQIGADIPLTATAAGEVAARFIGDAMNVGGLISGEVGGVAKGVAGAMGGTGAGGSSGGGSMFAGIAGMYGGIGAAMGADLAPGFARQGLQMLQRGAVAAPMLSGGRGFASFGAPSKPYVQIRRGIYPTVSGLATVDGKPAAGTYEIGQLTGFVQGSVKTDGLTCPENEKIKIKNLIASGIYV